MEATLQNTVLNLYLHIALALSLTLCGPENVLEIELGKSNNTFTCEGLKKNETVTWNLSQPIINPSELLLGVCQPLTAGIEPCRPNIPELCNIQRTLDTSSDVIVNASYPNIKERFRDSKLKCATMNSNATCLIDFIYAAEGVTCSVQFRSGNWSLVGQCNISTAYSTLSRYNCQWFRTQNAQTIFLTTTNITYKTSSTSDNIAGFCILNASLPLNNGIYAVTVDITPGNKSFTSTFIGNNTIDRPSILPNINCMGNNGQYAQEGVELTCTCTVPDLGQPPGRLIFYWHTNTVIYGKYSEKLVLMMQRVTRQDNRKVIKCVLEWATRNDDLHVNYTIAVAYGPDNVSINSPSVFDIHPSKNDLLTITCNSSEAYPSVMYQWTGRCSNETGRTCSFLPIPTDNIINVTCTVSNSFSNITRKASHLVELNYPPTNPPVIVNYAGEPLYSGQSKTISCNVSGGKPPVINVTLNCQGESQTDDGQMANITMALNSSHNGKMCTCRSFWKNPDWYTSLATVTLLVYYPPQTPGITYRGQQYPFMEGDTCTLFCGFPNEADRGNPPAHLAWQSHEVTIVMRTDSSNVTLTLNHLNKTHNGRNFVCHAVNNFTTVTNSRVSANVTIKVYYRPILTLSALPDSGCLSNSTPWQCVLVDGQFIDINCTADSNPRPRITFWKTPGFTLPSNKSENLHIVSANHSLHTGIYFCNATSEGNDNDSRLPLSSESDLHIFVKYKAEQINMSLNFAFGDVTVNEHEHLTIGCQANGRPTPMLSLYKGNTSSQLLQREPGGILNISEERSILSYSINSLHCENSSTYTCIARNEVEDSSIKATQQLYVNCKPRYSGGDFPALIYSEHPLSLKLKLVAYPVPDIYNVRFLGLSPNLNSSNGTVTENIFHLTCFAPEILYDINCEITVANITSKEQEGYYELEVSNNYGKEIIVFEIKVPDTGRQGNTTSYAAAIGGGVSAAIAIVAIIVAIYFVLQRRIRVKKQDTSRVKCIQNAPEGEHDAGTVIQNDLYGDVTGNVGTTKDLSMNPQRENTEYENVAFEKDNTEDDNQVIVYPAETQMHKDGLIYTTVQFSDTQAKRDELPPKMEPTEYAKIDFDRTHIEN